jgi:hypothetical protein
MRPVTPYEKAMEELALKLAGLNQVDDVATTPPPTGDDEDEQDQPAKR